MKFASFLHCLRVSTLLLLFVCMNLLYAQQLETKPQTENSPAEIGRLLLNAMQTSDFSILANVIPNADEIAKLMEMNDLEAEDSLDLKSSAKDWHRSLHMKLAQEWKDMLTNAEQERVKLPKLAFGRILETEDYPQLGYPTKLVRMELGYRKKSFVLAYWVVQIDMRWYYVGCYEPTKVFHQFND